jgi:2-amino-4-hydroxy-6-hydroxymethyldihydropteridine diphosphokinase
MKTPLMNSVSSGTFVVAFGANLNDPIDTLKKAYAELAISWTCMGASHLYRTAPVGGVEQGDFTNAIAVFQADLTPHQVLQELHRVENEFGRTREVRWGPRTLDLDLIAMWDGDQPVHLDTEELTVPHPRAAERSFVTVPWTDIDLPQQFRVLPEHGEVDSLPSSREQLVQLTERLDS